MVDGSVSPLHKCTRIEKSRFSARLNFLSVLRDTGWRDLEFWLLDLEPALSAIIHIAGLSWIDSLLNASMILGGMGPVDPLRTNGAKIFASCYALFSGLAFIGIVSVLLAPFVHRLLHRVHAEEREQ